jgi:hypothetical protein
MSSPAQEPTPAPEPAAAAADRAEPVAPPQSPAPPPSVVDQGPPPAAPRRRKSTRVSDTPLPMGTPDDRWTERSGGYGNRRSNFWREVMQKEQRAVAAAAGGRGAGGEDAQQQKGLYGILPGPPPGGGGGGGTGRPYEPLGRSPRRHRADHLAQGRTQRLVAEEAGDGEDGGAGGRRRRRRRRDKPLSLGESARESMRRGVAHRDVASRTRIAAPCQPLPTDDSGVARTMVGYWRPASWEASEGVVRGEQQRPAAAEAGGGGGGGTGRRTMRRFGKLGGAPPREGQEAPYEQASVREALLSARSRKELRKLGRAARVLAGNRAMLEASCAAGVGAAAEALANGDSGFAKGAGFPQGRRGMQRMGWEGELDGRGAASVASF